MELRRTTLIPTVLLLLLSTSCGGTPAAPATPSPTQTRVVVPPTPRPTLTRRPTATPDATATARAEDLSQVLAAYQEKGYVGSADQPFELEPLTQEWAQIGWYQWGVYDEVDQDFLFSAHYRWSTESSTPEESGCGLVFGIQPSGDHYGVFIGFSRIVFLMSRGGTAYQVGKTTGSGRVKFGNPAEADFALAVQGDKAYASVDGDFTVYTLSRDQSTRGQFGYSILSGTNRGYGTRCEITNAAFWMVE